MCKPMPDPSRKLPVVEHGGTKTKEGNMTETERKLQRFRQFKAGWHYGEGERINRDCIEKALALHREIDRTLSLKTNAFPGLCGEVVLTAYSGDHYWEFIFETDGTLTLCHEMEDKEVCYRENLPDWETAIKGETTLGALRKEKT